MGLMTQSRKLDPVRLVAAKRKRVERGYVRKEIALGGRGIVDGLRGERGTVIWPVGNEPGVDQQPVESVSVGLGHLPVGDGVADLRDLRRCAIAHFFKAERSERPVELSLQQGLLLVEVVWTQ